MITETTLASSNASANSTVVLNDTLVAATTAKPVLATTYAFIERLVNERELWEQNAYKTSNDQLYELLTQCYQYYQAMCIEGDEAKALREGLKDYINLKGYVFSKSTHSINRIVKCVFGIDRRRVSAYGIVLRSALAKSTHVSDLANFIRNNGGVEEIRLAKSSTAMSPKQKAQIASSTVVVNDIGSFSSAALSAQLDAGKIGTNTVLIGTWQADGSIVIRTVVESDTALNAALAAHYSSIQADIAKKASESKQAEVEEARQRLAAEAAASATVKL